MSTTTFGVKDNVAANYNVPVRQIDTAGTLCGHSINSSGAPSYSAAIYQLTPVATPTDLVQIVCTGTTYRLLIRRITVSATGTAAGVLPFELIRRSTAFTTVGSAVLSSVTVALNAVGATAAAFTVKTVGTGNFTTVGTAVGTLRANLAFVGDAATVQSQVVVWDFQGGQNLVLSGTSDFLYLNCNGGALPTGCKVDMTIECEQVPV